MTSLLELDQAMNLPVQSYFDNHILQQEIKALFSAPYVGNVLQIPNKGDYLTVDHSLEHNGKVLIRQKNDEVLLLSNICRHRQAVILKEKGNTPNIVCPLHRWSYQNNGEMLGAPHFEKKPCLNLPQFSHETWNYLAFDMSNANELAQNSLNYIKNQFDLQAFADIDFSGYVHDRTLIDDYDCNWKTFIEVYLEDYHVLPFHPGLGNLVDCEDLKWEFSDYHSVQTVSSTPDLNEAGSSAYRQYQQKILELNGGKAPKQGAIWFLLYPNVMIEWYPFVLTVSTVWPQGVNKTRNVVEFYYPEEIACFERDLVEAQQNAYMETAREDDEIAKRMEAGRKSLWQRGAPLAEQIGPYQPHFEKGMFKFHEYLRKHLQCYT